MGNWISENIIRNLETYVFNRRQKKPPGDTYTDGSQSCTPDTLSLVIHTEQRSNSLSVPITSTTITSSIRCSEFYIACRNNNIDKVKRLIKRMNLDQIDQTEPNGSTALHVACYYGHKDIVKLLLEIGADRAIPNNHNNLPFDEALNHEIQALFFRIPNSGRLVSDTGAIEWELVDEEVLDKAVEERQIIESIYNTIELEKMFQRIEKNYIGKGLAHFNGIETIKRFFEKATKEQNPLWIIKAYTAETDFYKVLNKEIAGGTNKYQNEQRYIIALLSHHPILNQLTFIGTAYRVMRLNFTDLEKYQVDTSLMTKSFLSSSIEEKLATCFLYRHEAASKEIGGKQRFKANGKVIKKWVMCIYNIKHQRTALHIENSSQYAMEGEILIMPYTVFKVTRIQEVRLPYTAEGLSIIEIKLEECDQYSDT